MRALSHQPHCLRSSGAAALTRMKAGVGGLEIRTRNRSTGRENFDVARARWCLPLAIAAQITPARILFSVGIFPSSGEPWPAPFNRLGQWRGDTGRHFFGGETVTRAALAEPMPEAEASPWQPLSTAPRTRPILLRSKWAGRPIAIVGEWVEVHGCFCSPALFGHDHQQIFANSWAELPPLLEG